MNEAFSPAVISTFEESYRVWVSKKEILARRSCWWRVQWKVADKIVHEVVATGEDILQGKIKAIELTE